MTNGDIPSEDSSHEHISCPNCNVVYRIPRTEQALRITCRHCQTVFYKNLPRPNKNKRNKYLYSAIAIALTIAIVLIIQFSKKNTPSSNKSTLPTTDKTPQAGNSTFESAISSNWITISYSDLVDGSILTHSGEPVSKVVRKIPDYDDNLKGLVQQYLEPYSVLCQDALLSTSEPDTLPLVNIISYYPTGSEQPAWASLFREGHFQLYFNSNLIRLFLKGSNPLQSFDKYHSIVRLAIQDVINRYRNSIKKLELYVFNNDYSSMELRLNTIPAIYAVSDLDLSTKRKPLDLASIESFLNEGVILEAVEVDGNNDLFFYGRKSSGQSLAHSPISLSDIAVVYRSVFHYGYNAPYISLDKHEDNRFAKVNFGGLLENTHVGHVVLEADKLFKTLSTGIDPNTHEILKSRISKVVPGFLTEDEHSLLEDEIEGHSQIRYWFYPDSIGTVTDGSIGVVLTHQFLADVERMDVKVSVSNATRRTIDHLNQHYGDYENAENTYKELSTVGRIMALVNWMKGMNVNDRIELDDFLSVPLPAFTTPQRTKKMLAVSAIAYPKDSPPTTGDVQSDSRVFYLSNLLDRYSANTSDERFLEIASHSVNDISNLASPRVSALNSRIEMYEPLIRSNEPTIASLERQIEQRKYSLDRSNEYEVDSYNTLIDRYNNLIATQKSYVNTYNSAVEELKEIAVKTRHITSIGGGIDLSPKEFKLISRDESSPQIRELNGIRNIMRTVGKVARYGDWVRSNAVDKAPRVNMLPKTVWTSSRTTNGIIKYSYHSNSGDIASTTILPNGKEWESMISVNGSRDRIKLSKGPNFLYINHTQFKQEYVGRISADGKRIVFSK